MLFLSLNFGTLVLLILLLVIFVLVGVAIVCLRLRRRRSDDAAQPKRRQPTATDRRRPPPRRTMATTRRAGFGTAHCKLPTHDAAPGRSRAERAVASAATTTNNARIHCECFARRGRHRRLKYLASGFDLIFFSIYVSNFHGTKHL